MLLMARAIWAVVLATAVAMGTGCSSRYVHPASIVPSGTVVHMDLADGAVLHVVEGRSGTQRLHGVQSIEGRVLESDGARMDVAPIRLEDQEGWSRVSSPARIRVQVPDIRRIRSGVDPSGAIYGLGVAGGMLLGLPLLALVLNILPGD